MSHDFLWNYVIIVIVIVIVIILMNAVPPKSIIVRKQYNTVNNIDFEN